MPMPKASATRLALPSNAQATTPPQGGQPLLVGVADVARLLNVSARTVWSLTDTGQLPHLRIGRRVLYPLESVRAWTIARTQAFVPPRAHPSTPVQDSEPTLAPNPPPRTASRASLFDHARGD
jgi:excisionase family DNA binding protein